MAAISTFYNLEQGQEVTARGSNLAHCFVNSFVINFIEYHHTIDLYVGCGCFCTVVVELSKYDRDYIIASLLEKMLANP